MRPLRVRSLSTTSDRADITIGMTSDMRVPCFHAHELVYRWSWLDDPDAERDCWLIRIRGGLSGVVGWLVEAGVRSVAFESGGSRWSLRWNERQDVVEVLRDGTIVDQIEP